MVQERRGGFANKNPYKDRKEFKAREIKKSLTHRARLRKNYFKLLKTEGGSEAESKQEDNRSDRGISLQADPSPKRAQSSSKPLTFADRTRIAKERKEEKRKAKLEDIKERRRLLESNQKERERRKTLLSQKTKTGQPLMAPRINNMLEKIRKDFS